MNAFVKKNFGFIIICLLGLIPLYPLLHSGFPLTHDGQDHIARIANFYQSLSEGNLIPRWAGNLNWGYGHPILMFLYPAPSYFASLFHFIGFPFVVSVKIIFGLTFVISGIGMYLWIRNIFGEKSGIVAGVLYMYAPYRFVDFYVRGAIGEHVAFLFVPFVFYFLYKISQLKKNNSQYLVGLSLSITGLLLSHNALSIMFLPIVIVYAGILIVTSKNKVMLSINYVLFALLGFGLSSFFLLPAFLEGKYTLRDIVTSSGEYKQGFVPLFDFFIPSWSYSGSALLSKQVGLVQLVGIILSLFYIKKLKGAVRYFCLFLLIVFAFSLLLMIKESDFVWHSISLLQKFQFPWRLLSIVVFSSAVLGSISVLLFKKKNATIAVFVFCFVAVILYLPYYKANGYVEKPEMFYSDVYRSTTDTGESSPIWSVRFMEHTYKSPVEFIDGKGSIKQVQRSSTLHEYSVTVTSDTARIRENTLYFPNWTVYVNGKSVPVEFQDEANRGLITYYLTKGTNNVQVKFEDTKLRVYANIISIMSLVGLLMLFVLYKVKKV